MAMEKIWLRRFLTELAVIIALGICAGIFATTLLIGLFYIGYMGLIQKGLDPFSAMGVLCGFLLLGMLMLFLIISNKLDYLKTSLPAARPLEETVFSPIRDAGGIVEAFLHGLKKTSADKNVNSGLH